VKHLRNKFDKLYCLRSNPIRLLGLAAVCCDQSDLFRRHCRHGFNDECF